MPHRAYAIGTALGGLALLMASAAGAADYSFTRIRDSGQHGTSSEAFLKRPSINEDGVVAFVGRTPSFENTVYKGSGGPLTRIETLVGYHTHNEEVSINSAGEVAFTAIFQSAPFGSGIYVGSGGPLTPIAETSGVFAGFTFDSAGLSLNDDGVVAFIATLDANPSESAIYLADGVTATRLYDVSSFTAAPMLAEDGSVAFMGPNPAQTIYRASSTGALTLIDENLGCFSPVLALNNAGQVLWRDPGDCTGGPVLLLGSGGAPTTVAASSGSFQVGFGSLNDAGEVALTAGFGGAGDSGIFTSDDLVNPVIATDDPLFGSTVIALALGRQALNDAGQIAFQFMLADGRRGIARANPGLAACANGVDDDGDGVTDTADPGCSFALDDTEKEVLLPCDDGIDNDADGQADFPGDIGCQGRLSTKENPQCQDGIDNDAALGTDFDGGESILGAGNGDPNGADPNCVAPWQDRELAVSPPLGCGIGPELLPALAALLGLAARRREA